jgi:hypothetical protein
MTDHRFWAFMAAALGGGIPGDVIDILVWKSILKAPLSTRVRLSILFCTWFIVGTTVYFLPDNFLLPTALCVGIPAVLLPLISVFIQGNKAKGG